MLMVQKHRTDCYLQTLIYLIFFIFIIDLCRNKNFSLNGKFFLLLLLFVINICNIATYFKFSTIKSYGL